MEQGGAGRWSDAELHGALARVFGYTAFRPHQIEIVKGILGGHDSLSIMPTGGGKSLCFQLPSHLMDGVCVVISPLISLMKDQVRSLTERGIGAVYLSSDMSRQEYGAALYAIRNNRCKLLYVAPERLQNERFQAFTGEMKIALVVVDEAHCLVRWGESFRPAYAGIRPFLDSLPRQPLVAAFTATATPAIRREIAVSLELEQPFELVTGFDRPNLTFTVERPAVKQRFLREWAAQQTGCGIIYCPTRRLTEEVYNYLKAWGYRAGRYHAGLTGEERLHNQNAFNRDEVQFMVATNAFGMGIDKPDVRFVLHYSLPLDVESYYQEAGRAGRDGLPSQCVLLFDRRDVTSMRQLLEYGCEQRDGDRDEKRLWLEQAYNRLREMENYCFTKGCLRSYLLTYFGQAAGSGCGNCGNCRPQKTVFRSWL